MKNLLQQLEQLAPLAAAATPGEWHNSAAYPYNEGQVLSYLPERRNTSIVANCRTTNYYAKEATANAAFIAAARNLLTPENLALLIAQQAAPVAGLSGLTEDEIDAAVIKVMQAQGWRSDTDGNGAPLWLSEGNLARACFVAGLATPVANTLTAQALHAAEQCMTDVLNYYKNGYTNLVMDEAMKSLKNDGLKLVKAARKALEAPADAPR